MKKILFLISLFALFVYLPGMAQQVNSFNMFHLNRYMHNPAAAGTKPYTFVSGGYSKYWSGIEGSPSMQFLNAHSLVSQRVGIGGKIYNESTGLAGKFGAELTYAYHLPVGSKGTKLSMGLSANVMQYRINKDKFVLHDPDDEVVKFASSSMIVPDASFGLSLYQENKFFADLAIYQMLSPKVHFMNKQFLENKQVRHYFIGLGYMFTLNANLQIEPSALIKLTEKAFYQAGVGFKLEFRKKLAVGCYYRTNDAIVPFVGITTKNIAFGYTYGIVITNLAAHTVGTHEVMFILKINNAKSNLEGVNQVD